MKAIIIAAGLSKRMRPLTNDIPKCLLPINGKPILHHTLENLRSNNVKDISIVRGYKKEKIDVKNTTYFENDNFFENNILHSLMYARPKLEEAMKNGDDVIVTYSDIWFENEVLKCLLEEQGDIVAVVDVDWESSYKDRTDHTTSEAENVLIDKENRIAKIGKHIFTEATPRSYQGEFTGLWKFTPKGVRIFLNHFDKVHASLQLTTPFQNAKEWQKAYITDIFQDLVDNGVEISCAKIEKKWKEFDTVQDYVLAGGTIPEHLREQIGGKNEKL